MAQDKKQLEALLEFITKIAQEPGNEWFVERLCYIFGKNEEHFSTEKINDIYEICIERVIKEQAMQLYEHFPIKEIIPQLTNDFIKMERCRRRNEFDEFCLAAYQQIECITNRIGDDPNLNGIAEKMFAYPAYVKDKKLDNRNGEYSIAKLLFNNNLEKASMRVSEQFAIDKSKCIIYFIWYRGKMNYNDYNKFFKICSTINDIYQYRNKNHRGSKSTEYQNFTYRKIEPFISLYYLKIIGFIAEYIENISLGYPISKELTDYANSLLPKAVTKQPSVNVAKKLT